MQLVHTYDPAGNLKDEEPPATVELTIKTAGAGLGKLKKGNKIKLPNAKVSSNHCVFHKDGLLDEASKSGTFLQGRSEPEKLAGLKGDFVPLAKNHKVNAVLFPLSLTVL